MRDEHCYISFISLLLLDCKCRLNRSLHPLKISGLDDSELPECVTMAILNVMEFKQMHAEVNLVLKWEDGFDSWTTGMWMKWISKAFRFVFEKCQWWQNQYGSYEMNLKTGLLIGFNTIANVEWPSNIYLAIGDLLPLVLNHVI